MNFFLFSFFLLMFFSRLTEKFMKNHSIHLSYDYNWLFEMAGIIIFNGQRYLKYSKDVVLSSGHIANGQCMSHIQKIFFYYRSKLIESSVDMLIFTAKLAYVISESYKGFWLMIYLSHGSKGFLSCRFCCIFCNVCGKM